MIAFFMHYKGMVLLHYDCFPCIIKCYNIKIKQVYLVFDTVQAVVWFLARWADTYLMLLDGAKGQINAPLAENGQQDGLQMSRKILFSFAGEYNQGGAVLDFIVRVCIVTLTLYPGENELQVYLSPNMLDNLNCLKKSSLVENVSDNIFVLFLRTSW